MEMRCPSCNKKMVYSHTRPGRYFCNHYYIQYTVCIYDDGVARVYDLVDDISDPVVLFEVDSYTKLSEEYIEKMLMLV